MRIFLVFTVILLGFTGMAEAAKRPGMLSDGSWWRAPHELDHSVPPYLEGAHTPNNAQWLQEDWRPEDWTGKSTESRMALIDRFYKGGLITDQYVQFDGTPVLEVGYNFLRLSDQDKRKVLMAVNEIYQVSEHAEAGSFVIEYEGTGDVIGAFSAVGMQLQ